MNNWCICWFFTHIFTVDLIVKGLTARHLYKSFDVKGLIFNTVSDIFVSSDLYFNMHIKKISLLKLRVNFLDVLHNWRNFIIKPGTLNAQLIQPIINTLNKIKWMAGIELLNVSAPDAILEEFFCYKEYRPNTLISVLHCPYWNV
jgi:phosphorylcholine metabolism protein LicD